VSDVTDTDPAPNVSGAED